MKKLIFQIPILIIWFIAGNINADDTIKTTKSTVVPATTSITVTLVPKKPHDKPLIGLPPSVIMTTKTNSNNHMKPYHVYQNSVYGGGGGGGVNGGGKPYQAYHHHIKYSNNLILPPSASPAYQSNFQPIQQLPTNGGPAPVIMQYLPQTHLNNGIQYLQLIPTRPLIIPISSLIQQANGNYQFLNAASSINGRNTNNPSVTKNNDNISASASATVATSNVKQQINEPQAQLQQTSATNTHPLYTPGSLIGGYASNVPNLRNNNQIKSNQGMEVVNGPLDLSLNTNEYIPTPEDVKALAALVVKGRP